MLKDRLRGEEAEDQALAWLSQRGMRLVQRNYRVAAGPRARAGEVDLIVLAPDGTLVFTEVRARASAQCGGAAASVGVSKQRRLIYAARHYLMRYRSPPPCRFDVMAWEGEQWHWIQGAFEAPWG